jgi:hypothetical protein
MSSSHGFNVEAWKGLFLGKKIQLRMLYTKGRRAARKQMVRILKAVKKLQALDAKVKAQTQEVLGGEDNVLKLFGSTGLDVTRADPAEDEPKGLSLERLEAFMRKQCQTLKRLDTAGPPFLIPQEAKIRAPVSSSSP